MDEFLNQMKLKILWLESLPGKVDVSAHLRVPYRETPSTTRL